jgi:hypothetical protein
MYAAADGTVVDIHELNTARLGGLIMDVAHDKDASHSMGVVTRYGHLSKCIVKYGSKVKRGNLVYEVAYTDTAKLMLKVSGNYADPDNYGAGHSYMNFCNGKNDDETQPTKKHREQRAILSKIYSYLSSEAGISLNRLHSRMHVQKKDLWAAWDNIKIFRYFDELYQARLLLFPGLPLEKFAQYKNGFYANQPIVQTLPLKA